MMSPLKAFVGIGTVALSVFAWSAQAAVTLDAACVLTNATVNNPAEAADDCVGVLDNLPPGGPYKLEDDINASKPGPVHTSNQGEEWDPGAFGFDDWKLGPKWNFGTGLEYDTIPVGFNVTGTTSISWTTTAGLNGDWIVQVKQAQQLVLYLFKTLVDTKEGTVALGNFSPANAWSNIALFYRNGTPDIPVPAPATLLLMGAGLASIGIFRRRRRTA